MEAATSLEQYLHAWAGDEAVRASVARTLECLASAASGMAECVARGQQIQPGALVSDGQAASKAGRQLDPFPDELFRLAFDSAPVSFVASANCDDIQPLNGDAPLAVTIHPLDSIANLEIEAPAGTLFSIYAIADSSAGDAMNTFRPSGSGQLAAGFVLYGPHTTLVLTTGEGVSTFTLDRRFSGFRLGRVGVRIPAGLADRPGKPLRQIDQEARIANDMRELIARQDRCRDFARRADSLAAEAYRVLIRGGVFMSPREGGLPKLVFEVNPVALLMEQAGGTATDGKHRILDIVPRDLHQQLPVVFGATDEVERLLCSQDVPNALTSRSPLFRDRKLFRT